MAIAMSKTREQFPLSTKKVLKKTLGASLVWIIVFGVAYFAFIGFFVTLAGQTGNSSGGVMDLVTLGVFSFLALIVVINYLYQKWYYDVYYYDLNDDFIVIKKGPITPHEITIPYERIQDVYVDQDLLDRMFGLYDVHLSSATISSGMAAHIDGVEKAAADGLRDHLLKTVSARINRNRAGINTPPAQAQKS